MDVTSKKSSDDLTIEDLVLATIDYSPQVFMELPKIHTKVFILSYTKIPFDTNLDNETFVYPYHIIDVFTDIHNAMNSIINEIIIPRTVSSKKSITRSSMKFNILSIKQVIEKLKTQDHIMIGNIDNSIDIEYYTIHSKILK